MVKAVRSTAAVMPSKASSCLSSSVLASKARSFSFLRICKKAQMIGGVAFPYTLKNRQYFIIFTMLKKWCELMVMMNTLSTEPGFASQLWHILALLAR